ncbi:hypothetical protein MYX07_04780 [Patescibacteria group bacterium AH-259-L07]|nr:hypothetical protein [Patescibacteria group bacterium AH-259-L07]
MKQVLAVMCVAILVLFTVGCKKSEEIRAPEKNQRLERIQSIANKVIGNIEYIKNPRTGLCFTYHWGGIASGGPALATVPCDSVPPELLTVTK